MYFSLYALFYLWIITKQCFPSNKITNTQVSFVKVLQCRYTRRILFLQLTAARYTPQSLSDLLARCTLFKTKISIWDNFVSIKQIKSIFNDPGISQQTYLIKKNNTVKKLSHDLSNLWLQKITGNGVVIGIVDAGVDGEHADLKDNYLSHLSFNFLFNTNKIIPSNNGRATKFSGLISAVSNNGICGCGAAPSSKIVSLQIFDDHNVSTRDKIAADAISYKNHLIDIYLIDLNLETKQKIYGIPGTASILSLEISNKYGRHNLGNIFLIGTGIRGYEGNNCAFRGFQQRPEVFTIGSISEDGHHPFYAEKCTAILTSTLTASSYENIEKLYTTNSEGRCEKSATGTGVSASLAAGIIALLLEEKPKLTTRQIMILTIMASIQYDDNSIKNGLGYLYSYSFGFGMLNAETLVNLAKSNAFEHLEENHICTMEIYRGVRNILAGKKVIISVYTNGCTGTENCVTLLEQVYIILSLNSRRRYNIEAFLKSPSGTIFQIIVPRPEDNSSEGFDNWRIKILGFFGEHTLGVWMFTITSLNTTSYLKNVRLVFYGTCIKDELNIDQDKNKKQTLCSEEENNSFLPLKKRKSSWSYY